MRPPLFLLALLLGCPCKAQRRIPFDQVRTRIEGKAWKTTPTLPVPDTLIISHGTVRFAGDGDRATLKILSARTFYANERNRVYRCADRDGHTVYIFFIEGRATYLYFKDHHIQLTKRT